VVEVAPNEVASTVFVILYLLELIPLSNCWRSLTRLAVHDGGVCGVFEIFHRLQIGNEPRTFWSPSQPLLR
jgi:hypothetical protein